MTSELVNANPGVQNFSIDGKDGNDYIFSYIGFDRIGVDEIKGGAGNDYLVGRASLTPSAYVSFLGGTGADTVSFPDAEINEVISTSGGGVEMVIRNLSNGTLLNTFVGYDVEILSIEDENDVASYYMTEDVSRGEFRKVDKDEYNFRATGDNMDWYLNGLDTFTAYQQFLSSNQEPTSDPAPTPTPEPAPEPEPEPEPYDGIIESVRGKGKLKGTDEADAFTFDSFESFTKKSADKIIGFNGSQGDTIAVSAVAFPGLEGSLEISFASTKSKKELKQFSKEAYDFVYFEKKGRLYFDGNGSGKNWGDSEEGGLVAILKGKPELTSEDITLLA